MPARDELANSVRAGTRSFAPRDDLRHLQLSNEVRLDGVTLKRFLLDVLTLAAPEADDKLTRGTTLTTRKLHRDAQGSLPASFSGVPFSARRARKPEESPVLALSPRSAARLFPLSKASCCAAACAA